MSDIKQFNEMIIKSMQKIRILENSIHIEINDLSYLIYKQSTLVDDTISREKALRETEEQIQLLREPSLKRGPKPKKVKFETS